MDDLRGKTVFITGGAGGIGLGLAQAFAAQGMRIALADIDATALDSAAAALRHSGATVLPLQLDVRDAKQWAQVAAFAEEELGPVQVLCCNAGVAGSHLLVEDTEFAAWSWIFDVNVNGVFHGLKTFLPRLRERSLPSHIVVTASLGGFIARPHNAVYSATKAALIALCESLRAELAETNVGVSVLCPGLVRSNLLDNIDKLAPAAMRLGPMGADRVAALRAGQEPLAVGELVVRGIRAKQFWLFTHPELRDLCEQRSAEIQAAMFYE